MLKISYAGCPDLYLVISAQFILELCAASKIAIGLNTKKPYFGERGFKIIQGHPCWASTAK